MRSFKTVINRILAMAVVGIAFAGSVNAQFAEKDFGQAFRVTTDAPIALSKYMHGSLRIVNTIAERDAITTARRQFGMIVIVMDDGTGVSSTFMYMPPVGLDINDATATWNAIKEDAETGTVLNKYWQTIQLFQFATADGVADTIAANIIVSDSIFNNWLSSDTIYANTLFVDTIFSESQNTLVFSVPVKVDSVYSGMIYSAMADIDSLVVNYLLAQKIITDSAFVTALLADTATIDYLMANTFLGDTAFINNLGINSLTMFDRYITGISNDSLLSGADSLKLITEYSVQTRIDSVLAYVNEQFAALSQNMIEDTQDGESMIKVTDGDSLIFRVANDTVMIIDTVNNITINNATLVLNGDSIYEVADKGESFANEADSVKAVTSLATVDSMIADGGNDIKFAFGTKKVTRAGWPGVSGNSVNAGNIEEFLQKLFFPMPAPLINSFGTPAQSTQTVDVNGNILSSVGTITIPYATWVSNAGITFNFSVDNRTDAASDPADELPAQAITTIKVTKGASDVGSYAIGDGTTDQAGTIAVNAADVTVNPTAASSNVFTLYVEDEYPNVNTLNVNVTMSAAVQARIDLVSISSPAFTEGTGTNGDPYLVERNGNPINFGLSYRVRPYDETVTDVIFTESAGMNAMTDITGLSLTANTTRTTESFTVNHNVLTNQRVGIQADGDVYPTNFAAAFTPYVKLADRGFVGYVSNAQRLDLTNQGPVIAAFSNPLCKMKYTFKNTAGVTLQNNIGETGYLCFALPVSQEGLGKTFVIETFDLGVWTEVAVNQQVYSITTNGATVDYYVVCINDGSANTSNGGNVVARIIEK